MGIGRAGLLRDGSHAERRDKPLCLIIYSSGSIGFLAHLGGDVQGPSVRALCICAFVAVGLSGFLLPLINQSTMYTYDSLLVCCPLNKFRNNLNVSLRFCKFCSPFCLVSKDGLILSYVSVSGNSLRNSSNTQLTQVEL